MTKKTKLLDKEMVVAELERAVGTERGDQAKWASKNDVSEPYLSDVLKGRRDPGKKILDAMGLESVTYYKFKKTEGDQ